MKARKQIKGYALGGGIGGQSLWTGATDRPRTWVDQRAIDQQKANSQIAAPIDQSSIGSVPPSQPAQSATYSAAIPSQPPANGVFTMKARDYCTPTQPLSVIGTNQNTGQEFTASGQTATPSKSPELPSTPAAPAPQKIAGLARGGKTPGSRPIPGKVDTKVADDVTINAKKGEFVLSVEDVALLGGADKLESDIKQLRKQAGLPTEMGPKRPDEPDAMGRMDKPGLNGKAGLADGGWNKIYETDPQKIGDTTTFSGGMKGLAGAAIGGIANTATGLMTTPEKMADSSRGAAVPSNITEAFTPPTPGAAAVSVPLSPVIPIAKAASSKMQQPVSAARHAAALPAEIGLASSHAVAANTAKPELAIATYAPAQNTGEPTIRYISGTDNGSNMQVRGNSAFSDSKTPQQFNYQIQQQAGRDMANAQGWNYDKGQAQLKLNALYDQQQAAMKQAQNAQLRLGMGMNPKQAAEFAMMQDKRANPIHRRNAAAEIALYQSGQEAAKAQLAAAQQTLGNIAGMQKQAQEDFDAPMKRATQGIAGMGAFNGVLQGNANAQNSFELGKYKADEEAGAKVKSAQIKAQQEASAKSEKDLNDELQNGYRITASPESRKGLMEHKAKVNSWEKKSLDIANAALSDAKEKPVMEGFLKVLAAHRNASDPDQKAAAKKALDAYIKSTGKINDANYLHLINEPVFDAQKYVPYKTPASMMTEAR